MVTQKVPLPPYGPVGGTLQGLTSLQRSSVVRIDEDFLRSNRIAPGNEYKVVSALKFLGAIDEDGRPTESGRAFRAKGPTYTFALQEAVKRSYSLLFSKVDLLTATKDDIYNHFVMDWGLGTEMAVKASRFFLEICRVADIGMSPSLSSGRRRRSASPASRLKPRSARPAKAQKAPDKGVDSAEGGDFYPPIILALTPETAKMDEQELAELFRKMVSAFRRAVSPG